MLLVLVPWLLLLSPAVAFAADGIVEINEACAQAGCFADDDPGWPVTITGAAGRSYRLTSDLGVFGRDTTAIEVRASDVSVDLAGFRIQCTTFVPPATVEPCGASGPGAGSGIRVDDPSTRDGLEVRNGSIVGMAGPGVRLGNHCVARSLRVSGGGAEGIRAGRGCAVVDSVVSDNADEGIRASADSTVARSVARDNGAAGIRVAFSSKISDNVATGNGGAGLSGEGNVSVLFTDNTVNDNVTGIAAGLGSLISRNIFYGNTTPISANGGTGCRENVIQGSSVGDGNDLGNCTDLGANLCAGGSC